ncbi:MAG: radical SAM protein [Oscillospiraceae bacterium]|nr:radical SAM protein [Oscillospiraceae bacterium]
MTNTSNAFEIGPIRPPSEAESLLLRITRNCPWNKCKFCKLYKKQKFSTRSVDEIKADIDQVAAIRNDILEMSRDAVSYEPYMIREKLTGLPEETIQRYFYIIQWMASGEESVFLQDANAMVLTFDKLCQILVYLREKLPHVKRVTSYGRVDSLNKFSVEQFKVLKEAGLDRIHSGFESGSDNVLTLISKGYTKAQETEAGQKIKASGIELSVYYMPGAGGKDFSEENAEETADTINKIDPDFVRIRTFISLPGTGLFEDIEAGRIKECTDAEKMLELKKMIQCIHGATGHLFSDHIVNLFENVNGNMKTDKEKMLSVFNAFENLGASDRRRYQLARRMGMLRSPGDLDFLSRQQSETIDMYLAGLDTDEKFEAFLLKFLRRYV